MPDPSRPRRDLRLGGKIRTLRRREKLTQTALAERLGISASYLNLIEHNRRPVSAPLLIRLAQHFELDVASLGGDDDERLAAHLLEAFGDPIFETHDVTHHEIRELASTHPGLAQAFVHLYEGFRGARTTTESLASRISDGQEHVGLEAARLPSEEVSDLIQRHDNHFPELESAAELLWRDARLEREDLFVRLAQALETRFGVSVRIAKVDSMGGAVRRFDRARRELTLSETLRRGSRNLQLAHQLCLLEHEEILAHHSADPALTSDESRSLVRVALANYFAAAVVMPYGDFFEEARESRYDVELLSHRFRAGFEQVCHRLTTLKRSGAEGIPFHFVRIDIAGNISKRFGASGIRFPRFSGLCPRWNVHASFLTPGRVSVQLMRMPDGGGYFTIARTIPKQGSGYRSHAAPHAVGIDCHERFARELVYSDGMDLDKPESAVPVGVTCRLCDRMDCEQRAFPSLRHPLRVDPDLRGRSFFAPVDR